MPFTAVALLMSAVLSPAVDTPDAGGGAGPARRVVSLLGKWTAEPDP